VKLGGTAEAIEKIPRSTKDPPLSFFATEVSSWQLAPFPQFYNCFLCQYFNAGGLAEVNQ